MDGISEVPEVAVLIPDIDLKARVVYFPVRHNSPACAWHVDRLIREIRPDCVLIEGPSDATHLIPLLTHEKTRMPVAIYTTYIRKGKDGPQRYAAYYPLCDYSPELAAVRAANDIGARARFIDLTFPQAVEACSEYPDDKVQSLLEERYLKHSRFLQSVCQKTGLRDPDDLWDHLYEDNYTALDTAQFMRNVLAYCTLGRMDYTKEMLQADGCLTREAAMAAYIAEEKGRVIVVTGGFHTVALPDTKPVMPKPVKVSGDDAQVVLVRYTFEQLDRLNGYASGMPSPEFYQRMWEGQEAPRIIVEIGREIRKNGGDISADDEISALSHAARLAQMRGHTRPGREDVLDGVRSVFIKGSVDIEGVFVLSIARKLLAGNRVGDVPPEAGQPPIVGDFRDTASKLNISLEYTSRHEVALDLYRSVRHREISRFFHRLRFLEVPFGEWIKGPDFVKGENLDRVQEIWNYRWSPMTESTLVERSVYGSTLEEASAAVVVDRFSENEKVGQGRRADIAAMLLLEACRMGLHKHTPDILQRTGKLISEDSLFVSLVNAISDILILNVSREPLEAHHLGGLMELAAMGFERACYLLPGIAATPAEQEYETLDSMNAFCELPERMDDTDEHKERLIESLEGLIRVTEGNAAIRGGACGLLFSEGKLGPEELVTHLNGHLLSRKDNGEEGIIFLRGLLRTARSALWLVPELIDSISEVLAEWQEDFFVKQLPNMRLAFSDLTPRECDRVARTAAERLGAEALPVSYQREFSEIDLIRGAEVNRRVLETLERDGLREFAEGELLAAD